MPFGAFRPLRIVFTSRWPPLSTTAYTFFERRLLTNTVPLSPSASERASGSPSAQTSTLKPAGAFSLSSGSSLAERPVMCGANGCSVDSLMAAGLPCCHDGGGAAAGLSCACAAANADNRARAISDFMGCPLLSEALLELKTRAQANAHVAPRRRLVKPAVGLVHDDRANIVAIGQVVYPGELGDS